MITAQQAFNSLKEQFKTAKIASPELEAGWVLEHYANMNYMEQLRSPDQHLDDPTMNKVWAALERRLTGEPLAYILGYKEFFSNRFAVTPDVLIPRPETEHLVEWAINWLHDNTTGREEARVLDLGTGSGCIAVSVAKLVKHVRVTAVDVSPQALAVARQNAEINEVSNRIQFIEYDAATVANVFDNEEFDLILANPPYIELTDKRIDPHVKKFEPALALFAEEKGHAAIRSWLGQAVLLLKDHSAVGFEIGSRQGKASLKLARDLEVFSKQYILKDLATLDRVLVCEKTPPPPELKKG